MNNLIATSMKLCKTLLSIILCNLHRLFMALITHRLCTMKYILNAILSEIMRKVLVYIYRVFIFSILSIINDLCFENIYDDCANFNKEKQRKRERKSKTMRE